MNWWLMKTKSGICFYCAMSYVSMVLILGGVKVISDRLGIAEKNEMPFVMFFAAPFICWIGKLSGLAQIGIDEELRNKYVQRK